jgi:hypothetical protein
MRYNDISVLENMHCALTYKILSSEDANFMATLTDDEWGLVRKIVISMVL